MDFIINSLKNNDNIIVSDTGKYAWYLFQNKKILSKVPLDKQVCSSGNYYFSHYIEQTHNMFTIPLVRDNTKYYEEERNKLCFSQMSTYTGNRSILTFNQDFVEKLEPDIFENYNRNLYKYKYIISPPGDTEDCYRHWEAIACGCIPITIKHPTLNAFLDAPILFLNDWTDLTEEFLNEKYEEISKKNWEMGTIQYWVDFILNK